jgi:hypothetical protein
VAWQVEAAKNRGIQLLGAKKQGIQWGCFECMRPSRS